MLLNTALMTYSFCLMPLSTNCCPWLVFRVGFFFFLFIFIFCSQPVPKNVLLFLSVSFNPCCLHFHHHTVVFSMNRQDLSPHLLQSVIFILLLFHPHISLLLYPCLIPVWTVPCFLHVLLIYFIRGCAPHTIIMLNHDDSILFTDSFQLTLIYKYSRDSSLYFNLLLRNIPHFLFALKPYQLVK